MHLQGSVRGLLPRRRKGTALPPQSLVFALPFLSVHIYGVSAKIRHFPASQILAHRQHGVVQAVNSLWKPLPAFLLG